MNSSCLLLLLILVFSVNSFGREFSKQDLDQVFRDSNQGKPKAQAYLGGMYYDGEGVEKDHAEAAKWWRKAAEQGNVHGQVSLGLLLARGEGVDQDFVEAVEWYRKAAEQGDARGMGQLGHMYYGNDTGAWLFFKRDAQ